MAVKKSKQKPVSTFSIHDEEPEILSSKALGGKRLWTIALFAENSNIEDMANRIEDEIRNTEPCRLTELLPLAKERIDEMIDEANADFGCYTDAGFVVYLRKKRRAV